MFFESFRCRSIIAMRRLHRVCMRLPGTVARLTPANVVLAGKNDLGVTCLPVLDGFLFVALLAALWTGKLAGWGVELRRPARNGRSLRRLGTFLRKTCGYSTRECKRPKKRS